MALPAFVLGKFPSAAALQQPQISDFLETAHVREGPFVKGGTKNQNGAVEANELTRHEDLEKG